MNIEIITRSEQEDKEVDLIKLFLEWQGFKYKVVCDPRRHAFFSRGAGGVIVWLEFHNIRLNGFQGLTKWFEQEGLYRL